MGEFFCPKHGQRWYFDYSKDAAKPDKQCVLCIQENNAALRAELAQVKKERDKANANASKIATESILGAAVLKERAEKAEQFREALIDALVINHSYTAEHDTDPRKAVADLIAVETQIALDPAVSGDAQALIDRGRKEAEQENARLREALAEMTSAAEEASLMHYKACERLDRVTKDAKRYEKVRQYPIDLGKTMPVDVGGTIKQAPIMYCMENLDEALDALEDSVYFGRVLRGYGRE